MDHPDRAWKLLLQRHLPTVLARLFPALHALIDWGEQYYLPDKCLLPRSADSHSGEREPDFVAIVTLRDGSQACLHCEIQCSRQARFPARVAQYHARLVDRFGMPVISLAILGDPSPGWRPYSSDDHCGMAFQFQIAKLLDYRAALSDLRRTFDPVSIAIAAHLIALATRRNPGRRCADKLQLMLPLYALRGKLKELTEIQEVLDWLLPLPPAWQRRFTMDVDNFLEDHKKWDKNSLNYAIAEHFIQQGIKQGIEQGIEQGMKHGFPKGEAMGKAKGEAIGLAKGQAQTLKLQLEVKFGPPGKNVLRAIDRANAAQLERLAIALLDAESAAEALRAAGLRV
ncbi:hypothetical protein [Pseudoduganella sp.]|uniref:hypothetical protein n=1 Tax=Pseudoduganella sp. TaxID=1880898 RepID=UPI0035B0743C